MKDKRMQKGISVLLSLSMVCALLLALSGCGGFNIMEHIDDKSAISATVEENSIEDPDSDSDQTLIGDGISTALADLFGGPANTKNSLVGNWEGEIDFTDMFNDTMAQSLGDEEAAEYIKISELVLDLSISFEKEEYTMSINEDGAEKAMEKMVGEVKDGMEKYFEKMIADQGLDMSVDDFFTNMTGSSFSDYIDQMLDVDALMSSFDELEEKGTYKTDGDKLTLEADEGGETEYTFKLDGSKLTLDSDDDDMGIFPLELKKK